jgi:glycosyltransferase involved in cell wall biosynthesis
MDKAQARRAAGLPVDGFIAGMVAANSSSPSRKSFPEVLLSWRDWWVGGGGGVLYLHTTISCKRNFGIDLQKMLDTLGLPWSTIDDPDEARRGAACVLFPPQHAMWCGAVDDTALMQLYNSFDVLLSPSQAEGFGIPIVEAQACGVPVVTLNITSMPELTFSGLCLEPAQRVWEDQGGWRGVAPVAEITKAIAWADDVLRSPTGHEHYSHKARAGAEDYDWDAVVAQRWLPFLEGVGGSR